MSLGHKFLIDTMMSSGRTCHVDTMRAKMDRKPLQLRLPLDVKAWIAAQAAANVSSQNSKIIRAIRERMERVGSITS